MLFLKTALSVTAIAMLIATASFAQGDEAAPGEQMEATGAPTPLSAPRQKAPTPEIQNQVAVGNADAKAGAASYQPQQPIQGQIQQN